MAGLQKSSGQWIQGFAVCTVVDIGVSQYAQVGEVDQYNLAGMLTSDRSMSGAPGL